MRNEDASGKVQSNQYGNFQDDVLPPPPQSAQELWAPLIATGANPAIDAQNEDASGKVQSNQQRIFKPMLFRPLNTTIRRCNPQRLQTQIMGSLAAGLSKSAKGLGAPLIATGANPAIDTQNEDASRKVQWNQYGNFQDDVLPPPPQLAQGLWAPLIVTGETPTVERKMKMHPEKSNQINARILKKMFRRPLNWTIRCCTPHCSRTRPMGRLAGALSQLVEVLRAEPAGLELF